MTVRPPYLATHRRRPGPADVEDVGREPGATDANAEAGDLQVPVLDPPVALPQALDELGREVSSHSVASDRRIARSADTELGRELPEELRPFRYAAPRRASRCEAKQVWEPPTLQGRTEPAPEGILLVLGVTTCC